MIGRHFFILAVVSCVAVFATVPESRSQVFEDDFSDATLPDWDLTCGPGGNCYVENADLHFQAAWTELQFAFIKNFEPHSYRYEFDYRQIGYSGWMFAFLALLSQS